MSRPIQPAHAAGPEQTVIRIEGDGSCTSLVLRQVGWHGQSGAIYSLGEKPSETEPGSFSPLWVAVHAERIQAPDVIEVAG